MTVANEKGLILFSLTFTLTTVEAPAIRIAERG
jgi:hypothetical protein